MASDKASDNRTFLATVLGAIVVALVFAAYFMYGHKGESTVKVDHPATEAPAKPMVPAPTPWHRRLRPPRRLQRRQPIHKRKRPGARAPYTIHPSSRALICLDWSWLCYERLE